MKIAAVVTLYHPGDETMENIATYLGNINKIYLFDNTEQGSSIKEKAAAFPNVFYFHNGKNEGIAKVLNTAALAAIDEGFDWLLMMDQDSKFMGTMLGDYLRSVTQYNDHKQIAMFGVNIAENTKITMTGAESYLTNQLITSGTLLNLGLFKKIGLFDENLFIDSVDHDYAIRVLQAGYKMVEFPGIHLSHKIGKVISRASIKTLYLVKRFKMLHSPLRCYYMYRNNLYLQEKHKNCAVRDMSEIDKATKATMQRNFFYGGNMWSMIYHIFMARRDFRKKRMGKFAG